MYPPSSSKSFFSSSSVEPTSSRSAIAASLLKLAWYHHARGKSCCAQVAYDLYLHAASGQWVDDPEKMAVTEESTLA